MIKRNYRTDEEWLTLIQECRASGLADKQWCEEHGICPRTSIIKSENFASRPVRFLRDKQNVLWSFKSKKLYKLPLNGPCNRKRLLIRQSGNPRKQLSLFRLESQM